MLETNLAVRHFQWRRTGPVLHLGVFMEQLEHTLHVGQGVLDLPVDEAEKVHGDEQLHEIGVDHHQVAHGQGLSTTP